MDSKQELISKCTKDIVIDADNLDGLYEIYDASKLYDLVVETMIEKTRNILKENNSLSKFYINYVCKEIKRQV